MAHSDTLSHPASPARLLPRRVREFLHTESAGGAVLLAAAAVALVWANSPWRDAYESLWTTHLAVTVGRFTLDLDLRHWVGEGLMALFFFVVGLEIKRELVVGELRSWRTAALPAVAAAGGMVVPALLYLAVNAGGAGAPGWAVPTATDIAFAIGALSLLGRRVPAGLKLFLLTLAVVDDLGAIAVIALLSSGSLSLDWLLLAAALLAAIAGLRRAGLAWPPLMIVLGAGVWLTVHGAGIHATVAGVALALLVPARPLEPTAVVRQWASHLTEEPTVPQARAMARMATSTVSIGERLEHTLHPLSSFVIVPLFALANAGVTVDASALAGGDAARVAAGGGARRVVGKLVGITAASWLAVRLRLGALPPAVGWGHVAGAAALAGIGFTVSLLMAGITLPDAGLEAAAKVGILGASVVAAAVGAVILLAAGRSRDPG